MFQGSEYFSFGGGDLLATSLMMNTGSLVLLSRFKKTETAVFLLKLTETDRQRKF